MKQKIYFDRIHTLKFAAVTENEKLVDFEIEEEENAEIVGNIYKGRVVNVLSGMNAAFVYCGLARNCYLSMNEPESWEKDSGLDTPTPTVSVKEGDEILVQVVKSPRGSKGAKVSTKLSFVGKNIIYVPNGSFVGVSHKIEDTELREHLAKEVERLGKGEGGYVVRTNAPYASLKQIGDEIEELKRKYRTVLERAKTFKIGNPLFVDGTMTAKKLRNLIAEDVDEIVVSDETLFQEVNYIASLRTDGLSKKIRHYRQDRDMLYSAGISQQLVQMLSPRVDLSNGAYLIIQKTEALTVIDVNTGKFVGDSDPEETAFVTNVLAAKEIALQVRLRNIGGIVVVDFIDMLEEEHKKKVVEELSFYLAQDRVRNKVLPMSDFGLVEFTRKRSSNETVTYLKRDCPYCSGSGEINKSVVTIVRIKRDINDCFADGYTTAIVDLNAYIMNEILSRHLFTELIEEKWKGKRIYFVPHKTYHESQYTVTGDNSGVLSLPDKAQIAY